MKNPDVPSEAHDQSWQVTLWILFGAQLCTAIGFSTINPFLPLYIGTLAKTSHLTTAVLSGLVYSSQAFAMMIASPIWGSVADKYGRKPMVVRAMLGGGLTIALMGFVSSAEQLIALRVLQGFLSGVMSAASALVVSKVPSNKVGYAMGILQLGLWSGVSGGPVLGGLLSDHFGFRVTFIVTAVLLCFAGASVALLVKESHEKPIIKFKGVRSFAGNWKRILLAPGIIPTLSLRFLSSVGRTALLPIFPLFVQMLMMGNGHVAGLTGFILGLSSAASTASAVYFGKLGDKIGHHKVALFSALASALFYIPQSFVKTPWELMVFYTITGAGIGGLTPSLSALLARYSKPSDAGSVYGLDNSITAAGRALSPMLAAWVVACFGLRAVFSLTGSVFLIATIILVFSLKGKEPAGVSAASAEILTGDQAES